MKTLLTVSKGEHLAARILRIMAVLCIGLALSAGLWIATTPVAEAQGQSPQQMLQSNMPGKKSLNGASKADIVSALTAAVKNSPRNIGDLVRVAVQARKGDSVDIVTAAIEALGRNADCALVVAAVEGGVAGDPDNASKIVESALDVASKCGTEIQSAATGAGIHMDSARGRGGRGAEGEGNFANAPGNQNPPPGSISGGSAAQSDRCQVCHRDGQGRGRTLTISCNAVPAHIRHGDTEGPCPVTPTQNP